DSNEDDGEQNQDSIIDTWSNEVITGDMENMDIDKVNDDDNTAITKEKLTKTIEKDHQLIKRKLPLTLKQKEKPGLVELSSDDYVILTNLIDIFKPFYQTTNLFNASKYPTIGLRLHVVRNSKEFFKKEEEDDESNVFITLKKYVLKSLNNYFDENNR
ncbi:unnamed protein product, partial [Rotaria sordida]